LDKAGYTTVQMEKQPQ